MNIDEIIHKWKNGEKLSYEEMEFAMIYAIELLDYINKLTAQSVFRLESLSERDNDCH